MRYILFPVIIITYLLFLSNFHAFGVILDTRYIVVFLSAIVLFLSGYFAVKWKNIISYICVALSIILLGLSINEYFFQYNEEEVVFQNDGYNLYGTLYTPRNANTNCLVVFVHGSGPQARKEYAFHSRQLARNNVAAFAYDKRGSGESEGDTYEIGYRGYARDAVAAINKLNSVGNFGHIGLFAVSEGEWVSLIVDSLAQVDFIVMISASGASPLKQTHRELTYRLEQKGIKQEDIREASQLYYDILTFNNELLQRVQIEKRINQVKNEPWFTAGEDFSEELYYYPWWNQIMNFSPSPYLENTNADILVLVGKENQSYPYNETIDNFNKYINVETTVFTKGDHAMLEWKLGRGIPPPFFTEGYLDTYTEWIKEKCNKN